MGVGEEREFVRDGGCEPDGGAPGLIGALAGLSVVVGVRGLLVVSDSAVAKAGGELAALIGGSTPVDEVGHSITIYRRP